MFYLFLVTFNSLFQFGVYGLGEQTFEISHPCTSLRGKRPRGYRRRAFTSIIHSGDFTLSCSLIHSEALGLSRFVIRSISLVLVSLNDSFLSGGSLRIIDSLVAGGTL